MAVDTAEKIVQIRATLTAQTTEVSLIANNTSQTVLGVAVPDQYSIYALQGWAEIPSKEEAFLPVDDPRDSTMARRQKREFFRAGIKAGIEVRIQPIGAIYVRGIGKAAGYDFFPVRPGYLVNVFEYLTQAPTFKLAQGWEIVARQVDRGYGLLTGDDFISFTGYGVRKGQFLQDHNLVVIP